MPDTGFTADSTQIEDTSSRQKIGKYRLIRQIGEGEFGYVHEAMLLDNPNPGQTGSQMRVAIKTLKAPYAQNYRILSKEFAVLQELNHPSMAKWFEMAVSGPTDTFPKVPYLVAEFIPGEQWNKLAQQRNQISSETLIRWAYEITSLIQYLHTHEILHGDLRPHNIQVTWHVQRGQSIKVMDTGLGKLRRSIKDVSNKPEILRYCSPEQFDRVPNNKASEIYALGLLLYELCSRGSYPYDTKAQDFAQWKQVHQNNTPNEFPSNILPPYIATAIMQCLSKDPSKRPTAEQLLSSLEKEISGIGISSYIGILGARGSGKTCYLTSLYGQVQPTTETKNILEQRYIDLYDQGVLPPANALIAHRLNFKFDTETRHYDIVTKDYGGELLDGRRENFQTTVDQELLQEKRQEVYEFFQNARAILIIVETLPNEDTLQKRMNARNEIYSLLSRIAIEHAGRRQIEVPICFVLTKWDRTQPTSYWSKVGTIKDESAEKVFLEQEHVNALAYIEKTDWLRELYRDAKLLCPLLEVFPVFSFIGDHPSRDDIRPLNIKNPLIWATDQSDVALARKCEQFRQEHSTELRNILEMHWRLLNVEKICDTEIRKQMQAEMIQLSPQYLQAVQEKVKVSDEDVVWAIGQYQAVLQTKGLQENEKQLAQRELDSWRSVLAKFQRVQQIKHLCQIAATILLGIVFIYVAWEAFAEYQVRVSISAFKQLGADKELVAELNDYSSYRNVSPIRSWRWESVRVLCLNEVCNYIKYQSRNFVSLMEEELPRPLILPNGENFGVIEQEINKTKQEVQSYTIRSQKIEEYLNKQKNWQSLFSPIFGVDLNISTNESEIRSQEIIRYHQEWKVRLQELEVLKTAFSEKDKLVQKYKTCITAFSSIAQDDRPEQCIKDLEEANQLLSDSRRLDNDVKNYLLVYPNSAFKAEIQNVEKELTGHLVACQNYAIKLENTKKAFESKQDLALTKTTLISDMAKIKVSAKATNCEKDWDSAKRAQQAIIELQDKLQTYPTAHPSAHEDFLVEVKKMYDDLSIEKNIWDRYCKDLEYIVTTFRAKQKLLQDSSVFFIQIQNGLISNKPEDWEHNLLTIKSILENLNRLQTSTTAYAEQYSNSLFLEEVQKLGQDITNQISFCQTKISNLSVLQQLYQEYRNLLTSSELLPKENDSLGILREKKDKISKTIVDCQQLQQKLATNRHILPEEIYRRWPNECDEIMPKLQDNIRRCNYFMADFELREIFTRAKFVESVSDTPQNLDEKLVLVKSQSQIIYEFDTASTRFLPEDIVKLTSNKKNYYEALAQTKITLEQRKATLEKESEDCRIYLQQWKQDVQQNRSYEVGLNKLNEWLAKLDKSSYLAERYQKDIESAIAQIKQYREADEAQYKDILVSIKQFQFISAFKKIGNIYVGSNGHLQIMKQDFGQYISNFKCDVELVLKELPTGIENGPDIELLVTVFEIDQKGTMTPILTQTRYYNDDIMKEIIAGKFTLSMRAATYSLLVEVKELDSFGSDNYGSSRIDLTKVLNNENAENIHQCGKDGTIKFTVVPTKMSPKNEFPAFRK